MERRQLCPRVFRHRPQVARTRLFMAIRAPVSAFPGFPAPALDNAGRNA